MCCCKPNGCRETGSLCSRPPFLLLNTSTPGKFRGPPCKSLFGVHNLLFNLWVWKGEEKGMGPKLCKGGGEIFGDGEISVSNFRFLPKYFGGSPSKWQLRARRGGHNCCGSVLLNLLTSTGSCNQFCFILHSHRVTFSSNFCVVAVQLCSNPWQNSFVQIHGRTVLFKAKFGTTPQKQPKNDQKWGWGHLWYK